MPPLRLGSEGPYIKILMPGYNNGIILPMARENNKNITYYVNIINKLYNFFSERIYMLALIYFHEDIFIFIDWRHFGHK